MLLSGEPFAYFYLFANMLLCTCRKFILFRLNRKPLSIFRFMEEWKSQGEVNALRASLKTHASVKRDGVFAMIESSKVTKII